MAECNCWLLVSIGDHSFKTEIRELKEILYMIGNHKAQIHAKNHRSLMVNNREICYTQYENRESNFSSL